LGDDLLESSISEEINRITYLLDVGYISQSTRKQLLDRLHELVERRQRIREAFDGKKDTSHNESSDNDSAP